MLSNLAIGMIVRDEAENLRRFLPGMVSLAEQVVVVDTGSHDNSVEIARELGAEVSEHPWQDDFAAARNEVLARIQRPWVLVLDADEQILPEDWSNLQTLLEDPAVDAYQLEIRTYQNRRSRNWLPVADPPAAAAHCRGYIPTTLARLFRFHPDLRYQGCVHETIEPALQQQGYRIAPAGVVIHHYGRATATPVREFRQKLYEQLGRQKLSNHPDDPRAAYELAVQLVENNKLTEAARWFERAARAAPQWLECQIDWALLLSQLGRDNKALEVIESALSVAAGNSLLLYYRGMLMGRLGHYGEALSALEQAARRGAVPPEFWYSMASLHANLGNFQAGLECLNKAIKATPDDPEVFALTGSLLDRTGAIKPARMALDKALELDPDCVSAWFFLGVSYGNQGCLEEAIECFESVLERNSTHPLAQSHLARAQQLLNKKQSE